MAEYIPISAHLLDDEDFLSLPREHGNIWLRMCLARVPGRCGIFRGLCALAREIAYPGPELEAAMQDFLALGWVVMMDGCYWIRNRVKWQGKTPNWFKAARRELADWSPKSPLAALCAESYPEALGKPNVRTSEALRKPNVRTSEALRKPNVRQGPLIKPETRDQRPETRNPPLGEGGLGGTTELASPPARARKVKAQPILPEQESRLPSDVVPHWSAYTLMVAAQRKGRAVSEGLLAGHLLQIHERCEAETLPWWAVIQGLDKAVAKLADNPNYVLSCARRAVKERAQAEEPPVRDIPTPRLKSEHADMFPKEAT
jgi:hypothetical protein